MKRITTGLTAMGLLLACSVGAAPSAKPGNGVAYQSVGKRMAPVELLSDAEYRTQIGQPLSLPLSFKLLTDADAVQVEVHADAGLWLSDGRQRAAVDAAGDGTFLLPSVDVIPLANGRHYVTVTVFVGEHASRRFRSFAIPVQVGAPAAQKRTPVSRGTDGRPLRVLPARERP